MRTVFSVASKLLGVFITYLGIMYVIAAFALRDGPPGPVSLQLLSALVAFVFGFVLAFRTDRLADLLGVNSEVSSSFGAFEGRAALRTGVILVGLYIFVTRVGSVLSMISSYLAGVQFGGVGGALVRILVECVPLALALFLDFRADRIVHVLASKNVEIV